MATTWTEFRDGIYEAIGGVEVTEQIKQNLVNKAYNEGLPALRQLGEGFAATVKTQGENETGLLKVRDVFLIPVGIQIVLWAVDFSLRKIIEQTTGVAPAQTA